MKLEKYWIFKEVPLMFSYVLVVSACYILLISTCSMLKTGKLHSIANSAILKNLFKSYFKIAKI